MTTRTPAKSKGFAAKAESSSHVLQRAIAIERVRILFTPVPKAGCTAILWSLAELARLQASQFAESPGREVTRALSIHDITRWPDSFRLGGRTPEEREQILKADDWLRFTVVRHPFKRLWSAWQSKILLAEPQFIVRYSSEPWFPASVKSASDILKSFRGFMDALREDPDLVRADVHWAPQVDVIDYPGVNYNHIGQVEKLGETLDRIREHLTSFKAADLPAPPVTNVSALPYEDELFTEDDVRFLSEMYADDLREFGYDEPSGEAVGGAVPEAWLAGADAAVPALEELRLRHERVADLQQLLRSRDQRIRDLDRQRKREKALRREEHRRNQRLQKRLHNTTARLRLIRDSKTWRYTAPLRRTSRRLRRLGRSPKRDR